MLQADISCRHALSVGSSSLGACWRDLLSSEPESSPDPAPCAARASVGAWPARCQACGTCSSRRARTGSWGVCLTALKAAETAAGLSLCDLRAASRRLMLTSWASSPSDSGAASGAAVLPPGLVGRWMPSSAWAPCSQSWAGWLPDWGRSCGAAGSAGSAARSPPGGDCGGRQAGWTPARGLTPARWPCAGARAQLKLAQRERLAWPRRLPGRLRQALQPAVLGPLGSAEAVKVVAPRRLGREGQGHATSMDTRPAPNWQRGSRQAR